MGFRLKLIISYAIVILVTLLLAMALFAFIYGRLQEQARTEATKRLEVVTNEASRQIAVNAAILSGDLTTYRGVLEGLARLLDVRILLVTSSGEVLIDTVVSPDTTVQDQTLADYRLVPRDDRPHAGSLRFRNVQYFYYARRGPIIRPSLSQTQDGAGSTRIVQNTTQTRIETDLLIAVPEATLSAGWNDFLTGMGAAAVVALFISTTLALLIARSVARPLTRITRASVEIAQGNYAQQLPVEGKDEMGRLAASFNQMAQEVAQSQQTMRDFVANVSHELKTPLTSIQGFSQAIIEGVAENPAEVEHSAAVIYNEAARMRRLVDELLDLSRVESGQVELNRREVDLSALLKRVVMKLSPQASARGLVIQHRLESGSGIIVQGDPDRLEQVFTNILDNALKYSNEGGLVWLDLQSGSLSVGAESGPAAENGRGGHPRPLKNHFASVQIGNTGPVIPPVELGRIFERFYKLDRSRKRKGESTGLGLSIVKELVEAHQGTIKVTSQPHAPDHALPGEGFTIFTVALPLQASHPATIPPAFNLLRR